MSDFNSPDESPSSSSKIPTSSELYDFFNPFLLKWLKLPSQKVDHSDDDLQTLPNEHSLLFAHPMPGLLVIRTSEEFGQGLAKLAKIKEIPHDLFMEMIVLFWHRFVSHFWAMDSRTLPAGLLKKSLPKHWPDRKPDSHLVVFVIQQPVEIRLWFHLTSTDIELWKKPSK
jgi:hypothetical protein